MTENWNLVGHQWAVDMLRRHAANGEARHAYLFTGPPGVGRRTLALRFAQALNCTNPPAPGEFCGGCRDCRQIEKMQHPDLEVTQSATEGRDLRVDQVRAVRQRLSLKPYQSKYRVALFLRFEDANPSASNALLKTLEEAPAHVIMLLTAETPEQLLPTVVSRSQVLRLQPLKLEEVEQMLLGKGVESQKARLLSHLSKGLPGYANRLLGDENFMNTRIERINDLQSILKSTRLQRFVYAEKLVKIRKDKDQNPDGVQDEGLDKNKVWSATRQTLIIWLSFWRDVLLRTSQATVPITNVDYETQIDELAGRISLSSVRKIVTEIELGVGRLEDNVNQRLLAEVLLLDWPKM